MGFFFDEAEREKREKSRRERTAECNRVTPPREKQRPMAPRRAQLRVDSSPADPYVVRLFKDLRCKPATEQATWDKLMRYLITMEPAG
jgi:hypothetical protein